MRTPIAVASITGERGVALPLDPGKAQAIRQRGRGSGLADDRCQSSGAQAEQVEQLTNNSLAAGWLCWRSGRACEVVQNLNFWLYVVDNVRQADRSLFRLEVFGGEALARLIAHAKPRRYYEVPIPVAEFELGPGVDALTDGAA